MSPIPSRTGSRIVTLLVAALAFYGACRLQAPPGDRPGAIAIAMTTPVSAVEPDAGSTWIDCVGVLRVRALRGYEVANVRRFGEDAGAVRTRDRLSNLSPSELTDFCDWEACIRANGYNHTCWVNDAGAERCRVCDGSADCDGHSLSQADCVARASDPGRAQCHVGLLEECLIQVAVRGPADPRVTTACRLSAQTCDGGLPGDLSVQEQAAQHETDQVTIEECDKEVGLAAELEPDSSTVTYWQQKLSMWDGGLPPGEETDASLPDAMPSEGGLKDSTAGDP